MRKVFIIMQEKGRYYTQLDESFYRAFIKNGFTTSSIEINIKYPDNIIGKLRDRLLTSRVNKGSIKRINDKAATKILSEKPDIIFILKGAYLLPETISYLKSSCPNSLLVCFNPDDPFSMNNASSNKIIKDSILLYDYYFIWSKSIILKLKNLGVKNVYYFPFAVDDEIIYPLKSTDEIKKEYATDIAFVGNGDKKRNKILNEITDLLNKRGMKNKICVYGSGVKGKNIEQRKLIINRNILKAYTGAIINLNILREQNNNSINMRTFEIPGTKKFMLHEYSEEAMEFFEEGKEAEYFRSSEECVDKIQYYKKNNNALNKIAEAAYRKVFTCGYTYSYLLKKAFDNIFS